MKRLAWIWDETRIEFIPDAPLDPLNLSSFLCVFVLEESRKGTPTLPRVVTATTSAVSHPQFSGVHLLQATIFPSSVGVPHQFGTDVEHHAEEGEIVAWRRERR